MHCPIPKEALPFAWGCLVFAVVLALTVYRILTSEPD